MTTYKQTRNRRSYPRFNLNYIGKSKPKDNEPKAIMLVYRYKKNAEGKSIILKYSIGEWIRPKSWDDKMQIAKAGVYLPQSEADHINIVIRAVKDHCNDIVTNDPDIEVVDFKLELDYRTGKKSRPKTKQDTTVIEYFNSYIKRSTQHVRTIQKFIGIRNILIDYQDHLNEPITFDKVNVEFTANLAAYLYRTRSSSQNHVNKVTQVIKQVVKDAHVN